MITAAKREMLIKKFNELGNVKIGDDKRKYTQVSKNDLDTYNLLGEILHSSSLSEVLANSTTTIASVDGGFYEVMIDNIERHKFSDMLSIFVRAYTEAHFRTGKYFDEIMDKATKQYFDIYSHKAIAIHQLETHKVLLSMFNDEYKSACNSLNKIKFDMFDSLQSIHDKISKNEEILKESDTRFNEYRAAVEGLSGSLNFLLLGKAFSVFITEKESQCKRLLWYLRSLGVALIVVPSFMLIYQVNYNNVDFKQNKINVAFPVPSSTTKNRITGNSHVSTNNLKVNMPINTVNNDVQATHSAVNEANAADSSNYISMYQLINKYMILLPIAIIEIFLLFYFRIVLRQFNSTNAQLLQLKTRLSVCQFIENYIEFKKTKDAKELDRFEALIFSNLMPDADKIPSTFEGLDHLGKIISEFKPKSRGQD